MQKESMEKENEVKKYPAIDIHNATNAQTHPIPVPSISSEVQGLGKSCRSAETNTKEETYVTQYTLEAGSNDAKIHLIPKLGDIVAYFKEYCDSASLHGVRYLSENRRNYFEKIFWSITLLMCAVGCALMIAKVKRKLDTTPVVVTFAESETNIWHLPFPAVTICPYTKFDPSLFNFTKIAIKFQNGEDFVDIYISYLEKLESQIETSDRMLYRINGSPTWIKERFSERVYLDSYDDVISEELAVLLEQMLLNNSSLSTKELIRDICNLTSFSLDVPPPEDNDLCKSIQEYYPVWINENKQKLMALGPVCGLYFPWWQGVFKNISFVLDDNARKYLMKVGLSIFEIEPYWNLKPLISELDSFQQIWTSEGCCYTFNMINNGQIYNKNVLSHEFRNDSGTSNDWNPDTGYSAKAGPDAYPRRSGFADQYSGLRLLLSEATDQSDLLCSVGFTGYKIILHRPEDYPQAHLHYDLDVPFNKHASISINPIVMTTSPELEKYDAHRRQCYSSHEKHLEYFRFYTKNNCLLECLTNATLKKCGCVAFYMPKEMEVHAMDEHLKELSEDERGTFNSAITKTECDCLPSCLSITYEADASLVERPVLKVLKTLAGQQEDGSFDKYVSVYSFTFTMIFIKYDNGYFIASRRSELYGQIDFLANCGGLLGLFCGFSLISLIEFVYFLTIRLWSNIIRRWTTNRKIHQNPNDVYIQ